ncbi:hypothetical protein [Desulfovibrio sp. Huiquan2017]|uniref:hypothetical protein n=1 Tax=Desulfovibrio sp. Huiquan2017 TaxID=2816861 RepID=UPI001A92A94F|nr:hypothetical protein [Desulfovibrio sp. Huiquan2017]
MARAASPILAKANNRSFLPYKAVAAGIGWQGKSLLTVGPEYGPRIRLVTVLTGEELTPDTPARNRCGGSTNGTDADRPEPSGTCPPTRTSRQWTRPCVP